MRQFEVALSEEVVKDVMTPGKTFQKEIWSQENVENDADRQSCILLSKTSDSLLKLLVTGENDGIFVNNTPFSRIVG